MTSCWIVLLIFVTFLARAASCSLHLFVFIKKFNRYFFEKNVDIDSGFSRHFYKFDIYIIIFFFFIFFDPLVSFLVWNFSFIIFIKITLITNDIIYHVIFVFTLSWYKPTLLFFSDVFKPVSNAFKTSSISYIVTDHSDCYTSVIHLDHGAIHFLSCSIPDEQIESS